MYLSGAFHPEYKLTWNTRYVYVLSILISTEVRCCILIPKPRKVIVQSELNIYNNLYSSAAKAPNPS